MTTENTSRVANLRDSHYTHAELECVRPAMEGASEGIGEALRKPAAKVVTIKRKAANR